MSTYIYELVESLDDRWQEISLLMAAAHANFSNDLLHNALCRSISVLMVAQFESFIRDATLSLLNDINKAGTFHLAPSQFKWTFCASFVGVTKDNKDAPEVKKRTEKLIAVFDQLHPELTIEPFLVRSEEGYGRNPSPDTLEKTFKNLGVDGFFHFIDGSELDMVFSNSKSDTQALKKKLEVTIKEGVSVYPYDLDLAKFNIVRSENSPKSNRTFWQTFLDELLKNRHQVAHGSISTNPAPLTDLEDSLLKFQILQLGIILVMCASLTLKL